MPRHNQPEMDFGSFREFLEEQLPDGLMRFMGALRDGAAQDIPWPPTTAASDVRELIETAISELDLELRASEQVLDGLRYQGRVLIYERQAKSEKPQWDITRVEYAATLVMPGKLEHMQQLCDHLIDPTERSIALWVHPLLSLGEGTMYLLYFRHRDGWDTIFLLREGVALRMPFENEQLQDAFDAIGPLVGGDKEFWHRCLQSLMAVASAEMRPELARFFNDVLQVELTSSHWKALVDIIFLNQQFLFYLMEVGRAVGSRPLREAHVLGSSLVGGLRRAQSEFEERLSQAQRDHKRELKRRTSDHEKLEMAYRGLLNRATRQADDLRKLQQQYNALAKSGTSTSSNGAPGGGVTAVSLEQALASLF